MSDSNIESKFGTNEETEIIQAKKKEKYTDSMGNPIPTDDKDAMADLASGKRIVYYGEDKVDVRK